MFDKEKWKRRAQQAFERYIRVLEKDLPPNWTVADIERVMEQHYRAFMESTNQALIDSQDFSPHSS